MADQPQSGLSPAERDRYARQLALPWLGGEPGQQRLRHASVVVLGLGGLGVPVATYLTGAGVGRLILVDADVVAISNLHRQPLYRVADAGKPKVTAAAAALRALNPHTEFVPEQVRVGTQTIADLIAGADVIVDGMDDAEAKLIAHDAAQDAGIPYVWGTALGTDAMISVFWRGAPGGPITLRDLHPNPLARVGGTCADDSVLGPVCGVAGSLMAAEAIKLIVGAPGVLLGRVQVFDAADGTWSQVDISGSKPAEPGIGAEPDGARSPQEITAADLPRLREATIVDLREHHEDRSLTIPGAVHLPYSTWLTDDVPDTIPPSTPIVLHCVSGARSAVLAERLSRSGHSVRSLRGGIQAWAAHTDL